MYTTSDQNDLKNLFTCMTCESYVPFLMKIGQQTTSQSCRQMPDRRTNWQTCK